jgi:hypothetical protein
MGRGKKKADKKPKNSPPKKSGLMSTESMTPGAPQEQPKPPSTRGVSLTKDEIGEKPPIAPIEWRGHRFEMVRVELDRCFLHALDFHHDAKLGKLWKGDVYDVPVREAERLVADWPKKVAIVNPKKAAGLNAKAHDEKWKRNIKNTKERKAFRLERQEQIKAILTKKVTK